LNAAPTSREESKQINAEKKKQPGAYADDKRLRAIVREIAGGQTAGEMPSRALLISLPTIVLWSLTAWRPPSSAPMAASSKSGGSAMDPRGSHRRATQSCSREL
jgi:hypothetical protein